MVSLISTMSLNMQFIRASLSHAKAFEMDSFINSEIQQIHNNPFLKYSKEYHDEK